MLLQEKQNGSAFGKVDFSDNNHHPNKAKAFVIVGKQGFFLYFQVILQ